MSDVVEMGSLTQPKSGQLSLVPETMFKWIARKYDDLCGRWPEEFCHCLDAEVVSAKSGKADDGAFWVNFTLHYHETHVALRRKLRISFLKNIETRDGYVIVNNTSYPSSEGQTRCGWCDGPIDPNGWAHAFFPSAQFICCLECQKMFMAMNDPNISWGHVAYNFPKFLYVWPTMKFPDPRAFLFDVAEFKHDGFIPF